MKRLKPTLALLGIVAAVVSSSAVADHRDWRGRPHAYPDGAYVTAPRVRSDVTVGFVAGSPAYYEPAPRYYYYEPAPRYYYYEPAPRYYYYESAPSGYYYYEDSPTFPRSNSGD